MLFTIWEFVIVGARWDRLCGGDASLINRMGRLGEGTITSSQNFDLGKFLYNILFSDIVFKHVQWMAKGSVIFVPRLATL